MENTSEIKTEPDLKFDFSKNGELICFVNGKQEKLTNSLFETLYNFKILPYRNTKFSTNNKIYGTQVFFDVEYNGKRTSWASFKEYSTQEYTPPNLPKNALPSYSRYCQDINLIEKIIKKRLELILNY